MRRKGRPHFLRNTLLAGLLILIPFMVTYLLVAFLFGLLGRVGAPVLAGLFHVFEIDLVAWVGPAAPAVNLLLSLLVIFLLGLVGTNIVGRRMLAALNRFVLRVPLVSSIYGAVKQTMETFQGSGPNFQRVVLVQYPSPGLWAMGLVASERSDTVRLTSSEKMLTVFIPTTPNPTSGFVVLVPPEDVRELDYDVEEAFKFIVSAGIVGRTLRLAQGAAV